MTVRGWGLFFDWSGSGEFTGTYDDVTAYVADDDIIIEVGRETSQAASAIPAGNLAFQLQEKALPGSYVFAPETGPLSGLVFPGVQAMFTGTGAGGQVPLLDGVLDDFEYDTEAGTLTGTVRDSWGLPAAQQLSTPVYTGQRTGDLVNVVLDAIGWPASARSIDPGDTVVPFWWEEGTDAASAIQKLVDSEGPPAIGFVYAGVFYFRDRHHRVFNTASTTSQATYSVRYPPGSGAPTELKIDEFTYRHRRSNIINVASFEVEQRVLGDAVAVWQSQSPISVPAGTTVVLNVSGSGAFMNAVTPAAATILDENGAPINGDYVLAYGTIASVTLSRTSGAQVMVTIVGGGADALFTYFQVTANPVVTAQTVTVTSRDTGSVASRGESTWPGTLPWCNAYDAQAIADRIVSQYGRSRVIVELTIDVDVAAAYLTEFVTRTVSDRITVINSLAGVNRDFHIEKVQRTVRALGKRGAILRIIAEEVPPTGAVTPLTFDVAGRGFNDGQFDMNGLDNGTTVLRFDVAGQGFNDGRFGS